MLDGCGKHHVAQGGTALKAGVSQRNDRAGQEQCGHCHAALKSVVADLSQSRGEDHLQKIGAILKGTWADGGNATSENDACNVRIPQKGFLGNVGDVIRNDELTLFWLGDSEGMWDIQEYIVWSSEERPGIDSFDYHQIEMS